MPVINDDPFGSIKSDQKTGAPPAGQVNYFHTRDDNDSSPLAHHHSLGTGRNQASPGDHIHDGKTSKLIGTGMNLTAVTSVGTADAKLASVLLMLHKIIAFTET